MIYIGTHLMPWEVGEFRHQVRLHRLTLSQLPSDVLDNITLIPTLNLNESIIDWSNSKLDQQYYIDHFNTSCKTISDKIKVIPRVGQVTSTTDALKKNVEEILEDSDYYVWMDPDISYPHTYWTYLVEACNVLKGDEHFIVSPSTTKLWDSSWDVLVADDQLHLPYGDDGWYNSNFEDYFFSENQTSLQPTPTVKLGGGFGNLFTGRTLKLFGIPNEYVLYGGVDTYIMIGAEYLRKQQKLQQYKLTNLVTIQDFKFSDKTMYKQYTPTILTKEAQRDINENKQQIFQKSIQLLLNKLQYESI
jgi:hypothetical protein